MTLSVSARPRARRRRPDAAHPTRRHVLAAGAGAVSGLLLGGLAGPAAHASSIRRSGHLTPTAQTTVDVWHVFSGQLGTAFTQLTQEFMKAHPSIKVNPVYVPYDAMLQDILTAVAAGTPPTMAGMEMTSMATLAADNALRPLSDLLGKAGAQKLGGTLIPSIKRANSYGGTLYAVPMGYNSNQLYYNPALFKAAGLDPTKDLPTTWDELIAVTPKLTRNRTSATQADQWGYVFPAQAAWILEVRFWQCGAELFNAAGTKPTFQSADGQKMFQNYLQLQKAGGAAMIQNDSSLDQLTDLFAAGKAAMFEQSSTAFAGISSETTFDIGVATFPTMGDKVYSMGGYNLGIFRDAPHEKQQAAAMFAQWWAQPEPAATWTAASNYLPGVSAAWDTQTLKAWRTADPRRQIAADQLPHARPRPDLPQYPQIANDLQNAFEATMKGQESPKKALDGTAQTAEDLL